MHPLKVMLVVMNSEELGQQPVQHSRTTEATSYVKYYQYSGILFSTCVFR